MFAVMSNFVRVILNIPILMNALSAIKKRMSKVNSYSMLGLFFS